MTYKASLDLQAKFITIIITILFAAIIIGGLSVTKGVNPLIPIFTAVFLTAIYFIVFALRPISYTLTTDTLIIHRLFKDVEINRSQIAKTELLAKDQTSWSVRTFGVGGLFGYFGKFANSKLGSMTWYATRKDRMVLVLSTNNKKIIVTPDDEHDFVINMNRQNGL